MLPIRFATALLTLPLTLTCFGLTDDQSPADEVARQRIERHRSADWLLVEPHLPDPTTASPDALTVAADVLRARRMPEDALEYYQYALSRGGEPSTLNNRIGVTMLELHQAVLARVAFKRALQSKPKDAQTWNNLGASEYVAGNLHGAINDYLKAVKLDKKDAEAWNNLGASDFMLGNTHSAINEYKRAVKLRKTSAVFHSNLALAYFEVKDGRSARNELQRAVALDPEILHHNESGGYNLQVLASTHYAEICYEMARVYAAQGDAETTITWLTKASERGMDVRAAMKGDHLLGPFLGDERVKVMLANNDHMKSKDAKGRPPGLSSAQ